MAPSRLFNIQSKASHLNWLQESLLGERIGDLASIEGREWQQAQLALPISFCQCDLREWALPI